jgi:predicted flap endonuclease-1-like 5' DNA nuclease
VITKLLLQILFLIVIFLFVYLLGKLQKQKPSENSYLELSVVQENEAGQTQNEKNGTETQERDDLTRISGIGPKISGVLADAGISTFSQLADLDENELKTILDAAQIRFANPGSWIQQAVELQ